jgi:hypothetical protein
MEIKASYVMSGDGDLLIKESRKENNETLINYFSVKKYKKNKLITSFKKGEKNYFEQNIRTCTLVDNNGNVKNPTINLFN